MDVLWEISHKVAAFIYPAQSWPRALFSLSPAARPALCSLPSPQPGADPLLWHLPSLWPEESLAACDKSEGNPPCLSLTPAFASQFLESPFCISLTSFFLPSFLDSQGSGRAPMPCPAALLATHRRRFSFSSRESWILPQTDTFTHLLKTLLFPNSCFQHVFSFFPPFRVLIMSIFQIV